jgi:hypothetical protein
VGLNKDFYSDNAEIESVYSSEIITNKLNAKHVYSPILIPNNKLNSIYINSLLKVKGHIKYESGESESESGSPKKTSFIQLDNIYINNIKQWKLSQIVDLNAENTHINNYIKEKMLLQLNSTASIELPGFEISKNVEIKNKDFEHVLIEMNFLFLNNLWNSNSAYIKINDELYWMDHHYWDDHLNCDDSHWNNPIKIIIKRANLIKGNLKITIGIKLKEEKMLQINSCPKILKALESEKVISFDNFNLSIK